MAIALTMIGILAAVSIPTFLKNRPAADVRHAAGRLANDLRQARFRAVSLRRDVYVHFEPGSSDDFYTAYADLDDDPTTVPTGTDDEISEVRLSLPDRASGTPGLRLAPAVRFGLGGTVSAPDPDTDTPTTAIDLPENPLLFEPRGTVRWPDGTSDPSGAIYIRHVDRPDLVYAVEVQPTGVIKTWRLMNDGGWR